MHGIARRGITPAGAGKTILPQQFSVRFQDHPRRCGENTVARRTKSRTIGSPPQVRGKPLCCGHRYLRSRITPAGAGKTRGCNRQFRRGGDHPRRCGENFVYDAVNYAECGSPPQVRGKPHPRTAQCRSPRITPAGAGKTTRHRRSHRRSRDHPRRCGENLTLGQPSVVARGSPPQVRGKLVILKL